jgi:hypothetical protein
VECGEARGLVTAATRSRQKAKKGHELPAVTLPVSITCESAVMSCSVAAPSRFTTYFQIVPMKSPCFPDVIAAGEWPAIIHLPMTGMGLMGVGGKTAIAEPIV